MVPRQLANLSLPSGAIPVGVGRAGRPPNCTFTDTNVVVRHGYWQDPAHPATVVAWVRAHAPARWRTTLIQRTFTAADAPHWYLGLGPPSRPGHVIHRCLFLAITRTAGGGSDVSVVSQATWVLTRPRWDLIPRSARVVTVTSVVNGGRARKVTLVASGTVKRIRRLINGSGVVQPGGFASCFFSSATYTYRVVFRAYAGGPTLAAARAVVEGCSSLSLSVDGRPGPPLLDGLGLAELVHSIRAGPRPQRSASAAGRKRTPTPPPAGSLEFGGGSRPQRHRHRGGGHGWWSGARSSGTPVGCMGRGRSRSSPR